MAPVSVRAWSVSPAKPAGPIAMPFGTRDRGLWGQRNRVLGPDPPLEGALRGVVTENDHSCPRSIYSTLFKGEAAMRPFIAITAATR